MNIKNAEKQNHLYLFKKIYSCLRFCNWEILLQDTAIEEKL
jgi:hypothetical protein